VLDGLLGNRRLVTVTARWRPGKGRGSHCGLRLRAAVSFASWRLPGRAGDWHEPNLCRITVATCLGLPGQEAGSRRTRSWPPCGPTSPAAHPRLLRAPKSVRAEAGQTGWLRYAGPRDDPGAPSAIR